MNNERKTELLVGLFMLIGLMMLAGLVLSFGKVRDYFKEAYVRTVQFSDATGIRIGTPVMLGGQRIGKVRAEPLLNRKDFKSVTVQLEIFEQFQVPEASAYEIATTGLMGDAYIAISPSPTLPEKVIGEDGKEIILGKQSKGLNALTETAGQVGKKVDLVLDDVSKATIELKDALHRVNQGALSDPTLESFRSSMASLEQVMKKANTEVLSPENTKNLHDAIAEFHEATGSFKRTALSIEESAKKIGPIIDKIEPMMTKVDQAVGSADAAMQSFKKSGDNLEIFTRDMAKGEGLFKALLLDKELREDFKDLIANLKNNGVIFYKNNADRLEAEEAARKGETDPKKISDQKQRRGIFGPSR
jgi:phospholipid/cholesterol/gamma-HCH transport system substrate-binding protein